MIAQVIPEVAAAIIDRDAGAVYLDVRTELEFAAGHPSGAYNVPAFFFDAAHRAVANPRFVAVVEANLARDQTILVGCQSGVRSQHAAQALAARGFADVRNVQGGFGGSPHARGWQDSGLPVETGDSADRGYEALKAKV